MEMNELLNGKFYSLYGEVVTDDTYHLRDVEDIVSINDPNYIHVKGHKRGFNFTPDVIIDLGANVGIFTRYAMELFPDALIVAVEPDLSNCESFIKHTETSRVILLRNAIGNGKVFRAPNANNGAMEVYECENIGYKKHHLESWALSDVESIKLTYLTQYIKPSNKVVMKIDIEGSEISIFSDKASMKMLKRIDYITGELHYFAGNVDTLEDVKSLVNSALDDLSKTHNVTINGAHFYAVKR